MNQQEIDLINRASPWALGGFVSLGAFFAVGLMLPAVILDAEAPLVRRITRNLLIAALLLVPFCHALVMIWILVDLWPQCPGKHAKLARFGVMAGVSSLLGVLGVRLWWSTR